MRAPVHARRLSCRLTCSPPKRPAQRGFVALLVALTMVAMIAMTGLALDLGRLYVAKSELQNSADACALAAAQELTGANSKQLDLAQAAGITAGTRHKVLFQHEAVKVEINNSLTFSPDNSSGSFVSAAGLTGATALAMRYAKCTVTRSGIPTLLIQVLNVRPGDAIGAQQVTASAIAGLKPSQSTCALPAAICSTAMTPTPPVGTWLTGAIGPPGNQGLSGSFKWVDFTPPNGGANELAQQLQGGGSCNMPLENLQVGQPGNIASIASDYNTRFGIYQGALSATTAAPDFSGYAYTDVNWNATAGNAFPDFKIRRGTNDPYQTDTLTGLSTRGSILNAASLKANGQDRRLMIVPVVDCSAFSTGQTAPVVSWACVFLLHPINNSAGGGGSTGTTATGETRMYLEYRGTSNDPASPCASYGIPGGANNKGPLVATLVK